MVKKGKRVMIFGVFDFLHPGHLYLLHHARLRGRELVVVVARDVVVKRLKGIRPNWDERRRMRAIKATGLATKVVLGDSKEGNYAVLKKYKPNMICLGYDQTRLKKDLVRRMGKGIEGNRLQKIPLYTLRPHKADVFHTSIRGKPK